MTNEEAINEVLRDFLVKTKENRINWMLINENTVRWTKGTAPGLTHVTLQKMLSVNSNVSSTNYVLTIQNVADASSTIQINTVKEPNHKELLAQLFELVMNELKRLDAEKRLNTIKKLLGDI
jgi:hypothetical protein